MSDKCGICDGPIGMGAGSTYTPYPTHANKSICVKNIRADERERIEMEIKALPDPWQVHAEYRRGWIAARGKCARIARNGGRDDA